MPSKIHFLKNVGGASFSDSLYKMLRTAPLHCTMYCRYLNERPSWRNAEGRRQKKKNRSNLWGPQFPVITSYVGHPMLDQEESVRSGPNPASRQSSLTLLLFLPMVWWKYFANLSTGLWRRRSLIILSSNQVDFWRSYCNLRRWPKNLNAHDTERERERETIAKALDDRRGGGATRPKIPACVLRAKGSYLLLVCTTT